MLNFFLLSDVINEVNRVPIIRKKVFIVSQKTLSIVLYTSKSNIAINEF